MQFPITPPPFADPSHSVIEGLEVIAGRGVAGQRRLNSENYPGTATVLGVTALVYRCGERIVDAVARTAQPLFTCMFGCRCSDLLRTCIQKRR